MKTVLKNKTTALFCAISILLGVVGMSLGQSVPVFASQGVWEKEDFEYQAENEIIAFSDKGVEKAKTTKVLSFPEGTKTIIGNYSLTHSEDNRFEKEFGRGKVWDKVVLPNSVTNLGYAAFYDARIKEIQLSENLNSIGGLAFFNNQIPRITLPEKLIEISDNAFERNHLEEITIPKSVRSIGDYAFSNNKLHKVNILGETKVSKTGAFQKQEAIYRPKMNPFYENHFGYNGKLNLLKYKDALKYKDGEYSFLNDDINEVTLDFSLDGTSYDGKITIVNPHKWSNETQTELTAEDIKNLEDKVGKLNERLKGIEVQLEKEKKLSNEKSETIDKLQKEKEVLEEQNKKLQEKIKKAENKVDDTTQKAISELEKKIALLEEKAKECCTSEKVKKPVYDNLEKKLDELIKKVDEKVKTIDKKDNSSGDIKKVIETLKTDKQAIQKQLDDLKNKGGEKDSSKEMIALEKAFNELNKKFDDLKKQVDQKNVSSKTVDSNLKKDATSNAIKKPEKNVESTNSTTTNTSQNEKDNSLIRYPNKLTPKMADTSTNNTETTTSNSSTADSYYGTKKTSSKTSSPNTKTTKSLPSNANASVTENVNNGNGDYPIHHEGEKAEMYSADARQFVTFQTKNGKTFHLIINHDEKTENVLLLTEVSEADLLNMVETKEEEVKEPVKEVVKEEVKKEVDEVKEPVEKEEPKSSTGTYLILFIVMVAVVGGGYYFKVVKNKEKKELAELEEPDDYISEAEDSDDVEEEKEVVEEEVDEDDEIDVIL